MDIHVHSGKGKIMSIPNLHFIMAVWGESYTDVFIDVVLPSQLSDNNLPALQHRQAYTYKIYTTADDAKTIQASPAFQQLAEVMPAEIHVIHPEQNAHIKTASVRHLMGSLHKRAIQEAARDNAFLAFLAPDAILSDGSFAAIEKRMLEGMEMVLISGIRVTKETALPAIRARYRRPDGTIHMDAADLTDCAFEFPHRYTQVLTWGAERFCSQWPSQTFWFVPPAGILAHCWHLHPILVKASTETDSFLGTIDGDYIERAGTQLERIHVIQDSDEACLIEISRADHEKTLLDTSAAFSMEKFLSWGQHSTNAFHRTFVDRPILFKGRAYTEAAMTEIRKDAAQVIEMLRAALEDYRIDIPLLRSFGEVAGAPAIYLYGSGECGRSVLTHAHRYGLTNIRGFIDSHTAGEVEGLPVHRLDDYLKGVRRPDDAIIITSMYLKDIARTLLQHGITEFLNGQEIYLEILLSNLEKSGEKPVDFVIVPWSTVAADS
ncbi:hypothetical protein FW320_02385 [Azospirillum sp. Vi22]|uniref:hypothetical protein n=1 Tax=Azospirillum baldaniorum TaxID=1064539 RepID=UPI00157B086C|nr:hypothetical protein [Azospirillum baldaniorum]NUB05041.1 hypothetical protein [Azospirillum baldaniorum]